MESSHRRRLIAVIAFVFVAAATSEPAAAESGNDKMRSRLPAAVAKAVDENTPGAEIKKLEIDEDAGITLYDIEFRDGRGEIEVAEDGTVLDVATIVEMEDVPETAAAALQRAARGNAIKHIEKSEVRARIDKEGGKGRLTVLPAPEYVYEAELAGGGEVEVAADGTIIKGPKGLK